jgi:hypothetical protein
MFLSYDKYNPLLFFKKLCYMLWDYLMAQNSSTAIDLCGLDIQHVLQHVDYLIATTPFGKKIILKKNF